MRHIALMTVAMVAGLSVAASAATIDFQASVSPTNTFTAPDAAIRGGSHDSTTYGTSSYLYVGGAGPSRTVLSFDLKAAGGLTGSETISSVKLTLTKQGVNGTNWDTDSAIVRTMQVQQLTRSFAESQATWNNSDSSTTWTTPGGDFNPMILSSVIESAAVNATDTFASTTNFVAAAQNALNNNNGILNIIVRASNAESINDQVLFWSQNTGTKAYHPLLEVTTAVPEPATAGLLVTAGVGALAARRRK